MYGKIRTSHVGSFPLPHSLDNLRMIIDDLWRIKLDAPPYPQLRSFIDIYLKPLADKGLLKEKNGFYFLESKESFKDIEYLEPSINEAEYMIKYLEEKKYGFKWLRAPVTGAFTLASRIYLSKDISVGLHGTLLREKSLIEYIVEYVRKHITYMSRLGYNILFIDEPVLGVIVGKRRILFGFSQEEIIEIINHIFSKAPGEHGIHVCGRISPKLFETLAITDKLDILNFEFHDNPMNIESINPSLLEENNKVLAPGIASAKKPVIEPYDELSDLLRKIGEKTMWRIDLVSADCGFGGLATESGDPYKAYRIGLEKLHRIIEVVRLLQKK